jgi:hypothetical protein
MTHKQVGLIGSTGNRGAPQYKKQQVHAAVHGCSLSDTMAGAHIPGAAIEHPGMY